DELDEQQVGEAQPEEVDPDAADPLLRLQRDVDERGQEAHHQPDPERHEHAQREALRLVGGVVGAERAEEHDAVDAEVQHAAPLADRLAQGGEQEGGGEGDAGGDGGRKDGGREELAHGAAPIGSSPATSAVASAARWASAWASARARRRKYSIETTKITTRPSMVVTRSVGTPVEACIAVPPTRSPPNKNAERIVHSGLRAPNSPTTMPLKPALPVNPVRLPSVTI